MADGDGLNYAPRGKAQPVCKKGDFRFSVVGLTHGHIYGMAGNLIDSGAQLVKAYDPDPEKIKKFQEKFPEAQVASSEAEVLEDASIQMVATADIPNLRGPLGLRVMDAGKHFFTDKAPFTTLDQLSAARAKTAATGLIWGVCYSERVQNEAGVHAGNLIEEGVIGKVIQVIGMGPHRLNAPSREPYFFKKEEYGGILCDIGSHQVEQFLYYSGATAAEVVNAKIANYSHPEYPELEDFGDATLVGNNGATNYFRVDWFTPDGLTTWGDGRTFILGTKGYIELRKYVDVAQGRGGNQVYLVDGEKEHHFEVTGKVGFPYFGKLILDCLNGTRDAMSQEHTFLAAQLCLEAQAKAIKVA